MKFPWVLIFDLGISSFKMVAHNFAEFPGAGVKKLVFSRISKGNVTNLKFPEGAFPGNSMGCNTIFPGLRGEVSFCLEFLE